MKVSVTRMSEQGVEQATEWVRNLVVVNGVCVMCSQVRDLQPRSDDCEECMAVERNTGGHTQMDYRCITYSTNSACEQLGLKHCHRCHELGHPGYFSCLTCAKGTSLLDGRCLLRRKHVDIGLSRIMDDSIASNRIDIGLSRIMDDSMASNRVVDVGTMG